ncbi:hypothetical protein DFS34DRAFT_635240 [Phlyctochytrium arcticum]|nr:hypothetical protein DFS34DRAFT_635240 [Phlyctochytrium arcticum]
MKSYKGVVGGWPEFPKKSFFDRFNPAIIQQRLTSFATLLNFIVLHPKLYNGPQLLSFLGVADGSGRPRHEGNRTRTTTANGGGGGFVIWERATTPAVSTTDDPARKNRGKGLWGIVPRGGLLGIGKERAT